MKGVSLPITLVIFLILLLVISLILILWHFIGFEMFTNTTDNITNGLIYEIMEGNNIG